MEFIKNNICNKSIEEVYAFFLDQKNLLRMFGADVFEIEIIEGGEIVIPVDINGVKSTILGEMTLLIPNERFSFSWNEKQGRRERWSTPTMVNFFFNKGKDGTEIRLEHTGFEYLPQDEQQEVFDRYKIYWETSGVLQKIVRGIEES